MKELRTTQEFIDAWFAEGFTGTDLLAMVKRLYQMGNRQGWLVEYTSEEAMSKLDGLLKKFGIGERRLRKKLGAMIMLTIAGGMDLRLWIQVSDKMDEQEELGGLNTKFRKLMLEDTDDSPDWRMEDGPRSTLSAKTFPCPTCGTKVLENAGYCLKCKKKVKKANIDKFEERMSKIASKIAKKLPMLSEYDDEDEIADDLDDELGFGASDVNGAVIVCHEESTKKGIPVSITVYVDPRNQPNKEGEMNFGLTILNSMDEDYLEEETDQKFIDYATSVGETFYDRTLTVDDDQTVKDVAKEIEDVVKKILRKW